MICMKILRHELMALTGEPESGNHPSHAQLLLLHKSLAVGEDPSTVNNVKLLAACSVNNIACQTNGSAQNQSKTGRVASWAVNFQNLLSDPIGIEIFTEFLCKEFSEENIIFWKACEQYRQLKDEQQRKLQAKDIYSRHLSSKASEPVNVDSAARSHTEQFLDSPTTIMFDMAQHQIFQLMRQDSYSRFLKSDIYKAHVMDEMSGKPLKCSSSTAAAAGNDPQGDNAMQDKKKNKGKENEDKRRRSILPWRNGRKSLKGSSDGDSKKASKKGKEEKEKESKDQPIQNGQLENGNVGTSAGLNMSITSAGSINSIDHNTNANSHSSSAGSLRKAPGPGIDLSTMRKEVFNPRDSQGVSESQYKFCRIVMPDGSTTVVCTKPGQSTRYVLGKLCEKRSISLASVDVFLLGSDRLLDLNEDISNLGSKEIVIERRVMFRLDMPSGKSIGVKAKPNRSIRDVFRPILHKYGYNLDNIAVRLVTSQEFLDLDVAVSELDKQRAAVVHMNSDVVDWVRRGGIPGPIVPTVGADPPPQTRSLEEITNKIFEDLMRGKSQLAHGFDELGVLEIDKAKASKNEEGRSLGLLGLLKKESWAAKDSHNKNSKTKGKVTFALPRSESKKKENVKEGERLFELLSSAQSLRLEEQRGVHISPGELPSFLLENRDNDQIQVEKDDPGKQMFDDIGEISRAGKVWRRADSLPSNMQTPRQSISTPSRMKYGARTMAVTPLLSHSDKSFSQDGVIPTPDQGEAYFRMSPIIVEAHSKIGSKLPDDTFVQRGKEFYRELECVDSYHSHPSVSHAFQPLLHSPQELRRSKAPVASPEKFSPRKKKQRSSPENIPPPENLDLNQAFGPFDKHTILSQGNHTLNHINRTMRSPPFDSPTQGYLSHTVTHSTSSSSPHTPIPSPHSSSSPHTVSQGTRCSPQPKQSENVPQPHQSRAGARNRLSDGQLLHKLQQANRERFLSQEDQKKERTIISPNSHKFNSTFQHPKNSFPSSSSASHSAHKHDSVDLAQRALLSPRFDQSHQDKMWSHQPSTSADMTHRALLSPRFDQSQYGMEPVNYPHRQTSPVVPYGLGTVLSPRHSAGFSQREAYHSTYRHPQGHFSPTRPLVTQFGTPVGNNREQLEETVTFV